MWFRGYVLPERGAKNVYRGHAISGHVVENILTNMSLPENPPPLPGLAMYPPPRLSGYKLRDNFNYIYTVWRQARSCRECGQPKCELKHREFEVLKTAADGGVGVYRRTTVWKYGAIKPPTTGE